MNKEELIEFHLDFCNRMHEIMVNKNSDYSGEKPFFNFQSTEILGVTTTEQGFLTRMLDKYNRINNLVKTGVNKVKDEKIEDTLMDLANYSILMAAYIKHKKQQVNF